MRYPRRNYSNRAGIERAQKHIEEARALSLQLGGTDKDVKDYFFSLKGKDLESVLDDYGRTYGSAKKSYALETLPNWRSGKRKMSGLVAGRLFSLLPKHMPVNKKFELVESLWRFCGSSSNISLYVGPDADAHELVNKIKDHFNEKIESYVIDDTITNRFDWLAENDSDLCQELKNHFLQLDKKLISEVSYDRIVIMLSQIKNPDVSKQTLRQIFEVGKHSVNIEFSPSLSGISDIAPRKYGASSSNSDGIGCLLIIIIVISAIVLSSIL